LVAGRTRDPCDVVQRQQPAQRRYETATTALRNPLVVLPARERDRSAVGDDDQLPAHGPERIRLARRRNDGQLGAGGVVAEQPVEEHEPVAQKSWRQEVAAHVLLAPKRPLPSLARVA